ncbi:hypothetical protein TNCV_3637631 [Trichonephila clavipes]|nr:hypothetical protein TNCV_3637631 [Trichonephila clavipes]
MGLNASEIYRRNSIDDRSLPGQANVVIIKEVVAYVDHFGPKHWTEEQNIHLLSLSMKYLMQYHGMESQFLLRIIAADETWCHHFDPATKSLSMEGWHSSSPRPKKALSSIKAGKIMLTGFINVDGPLLLE